ncbi:MAG: thioesterase family protein [Sediminibacterium sp.]|nr:thioesterase family protein [Sediminibacterium sp.]
MKRLKIEFPTKFNFHCSIPLRITDINVGGHVGNDRILTLMHEARVRYLQSFGYSELNTEGFGLTLIDAEIEYKKEIFYPSDLVVSITAANFDNLGFDIYYLFQVIQDHNETIVAKAKTSMISFDYNLRKRVPLPPQISIILN